jgi:oligosaccharyltransferase complex subunit epsilon
MSPPASSNKNFVSVVSNLFNEYLTTTPNKLKLVDAYMFGIMLTGIFQFVYCCLVGTFPFNAFLSGFISTVASFVLAG